MAEIVIEECGCILRGKNGLANVSGYVDYCPKHAHADAMYAVLDLVIQEVHNTGHISTDTIEVMVDTLALADGDGGE